MWNRQALKAAGKDKFRINYWKCVLVAAILTAIGGAAGASGGFSSGLNNTLKSENGGIKEMFNHMSEKEVAIFLITVITISILVAAIASLVNIFALNPLRIGCKGFYLNNSRGSSSLGVLGYGYKNGYWRIVKTMFLHDLFLVLWTMLFFIPGIIKAYSYRMVPYILIDNPKMSGTEAITLSRQMMKGHKWRAFVLDLSFILWSLLSAVTLGVLGIFYVEPYMLATDAELYEAIKYEYSA